MDPSSSDEDEEPWWEKQKEERLRAEASYLRNLEIIWGAEQERMTFAYAERSLMTSISAIRISESFAFQDYLHSIKHLNLSLSLSDILFHCVCTIRMSSLSIDVGDSVFLVNDNLVSFH